MGEDHKISKSGKTLIVSYRVDTKNRIVETGGDWNAFARDNGGEELAGEGVIGLPLRSFVSGDVTRMFVETMLQKARLTRVPFSVPYRCDSSDVIRHMRMTLTSSGNEVQLDHRLEKEEARGSINRGRISPGTPRPVKVCSMCRNICDAKNSSVGEAPVSGIERIIYSVCSTCLDGLRRLPASPRNPADRFNPERTGV